ncbi:ribonuclease H2 subunit A-like [Daphnia carinata]|uniref:ribonuclease H2 subunit A-like n=1 Tax=Daphnia carinata TaxID=120202 RepID=UPI00257EF03F|nr:ribonuclease H2 subunit A-like [Daphnia carinata]
MEEGLRSFSERNNRNITIVSKVPDVCRNEACALGIDEAGRGPVLGPMVYGITYCPESRAEELKAIGCADSKTLSEDQREKLFEKLDSLKDFVGWVVEIISPNSICNSMFKRLKHSLNEVSHDSAIGLIRKALSLGVNVTSVFVDTVGPPEKYQAKLSAIFPDIKITVSKKADSLFPVVSAASICAKVARDKALSSWQFRESPFVDLKNTEDIKWGSGYPGDPTTKKFLAQNIDPVFGFPQLVRFSWSTSDQLLKSKGVPVEWEDTEEQENQAVSVKTFFQNSSKTNTPRRHPYFADRRLKPATKLV